MVNNKRLSLIVVVFALQVSEKYLKHKEDVDLVGLKNSPTKLTDFGNKILEELDGINFINDNKEYLIARLDEEKPRTALDVENSALMVFVNVCSRK